MHTWAEGGRRTGRARGNFLATAQPRRQNRATAQENFPKAPKSVRLFVCAVPKDQIFQHFRGGPVSFSNTCPKLTIFWLRGSKISQKL